MNFLINKDEYIKVKAAWNRPGFHHTATDHIFYNALRGYDLKRGFAAVSSTRKLQSQSEWQSFDTAKKEAQWLVRIPPVYAHDTPARAAIRAETAKQQIAGLSAKYGTEFNPELMQALRELLK